MDIFNQNTSVGVYILTHNRLNTLIRTLKSVINQTFKDMTIIVSDNSDNNDTEIAIKKYTDKYANLVYIHHNDASSSNEHFNKLLRNNKYEYFMLFHDDDEMLPTMVEDLYNAIIKMPDVSAVAANNILNVNGRTKKNPAKWNKDCVVINEYEIARRYINGLASPAFPGYMYRQSKIKDIKLDISQGGKYCDASYIVKIASKGGILILPQPLMIYYISSAQDSQHHNFIQYLSLIKFMRLFVDNKKDLTHMRIYNIYNTLTDNPNNIVFKREALKLFYKYSTYNFFLKYIIRLLKLYNK